MRDRRWDGDHLHVWREALPESVAGIGWRNWACPGFTQAPLFAQWGRWIPDFGCCVRRTIHHTFSYIKLPFQRMPSVPHLCSLRLFWMHEHALSLILWLSGCSMITAHWCAANVKIKHTTVKQASDSYPSVTYWWATSSQIGYTFLVFFLQPVLINWIRPMH